MDNNNKFLNQKNNNKPKMKPFLIGLLSMLIPYLAMVSLPFLTQESEAGLIALILTIPFGVVGFVAWIIASFASDKRFLGLGLLIGGVSPFLFVVIVTGGCGLFF